MLQGKGADEPRKNHLFLFFAAADNETWLFGTKSPSRIIYICLFIFLSIFGDFCGVRTPVSRTA